MKLSTKEKLLISIGLCLAGDFLKTDCKTMDQEFAITKQIAEIVVKLEMSKEFGFAAAQTAGFVEIVREAVRKLER
jgi:hypothetical protein